MADAAHEGKAAPPYYEISLMGLCRQFNALPSQIEDEDADLIIKMMVMNNTYDAIKAVRNAKGDAIHNVSPAYKRIIKELMDDGIYKGGL